MDDELTPAQEEDVAGMKASIDSTLELLDDLMNEIADGKDPNKNPNLFARVQQFLASSKGMKNS